MNMFTIQRLKPSKGALTWLFRHCSDSAKTCATTAPQSKQPWSSKLPEWQQANTWTNAYGCPSCSMKFSGWKACWKHMKGQNHVRRGVYATKEQLRELLKLPHRDAELSAPVITLLRNEASEKIDENASAQENKVRWMYECPLCHFATSNWVTMWEHVGRSGHITRESYKNKEQLRLLLRKEKPPGSLALAFREDAKWVEDGKAVHADGEDTRVMLKAGTPLLANHSTGDQPSRQADGTEPAISASQGSTACESGSQTSTITWTPAMQRSLTEAFKEYPAKLQWKDRHALIAERVGHGVTGADVAARIKHMNLVGGGGGVDLAGMRLSSGYIAVDWECCGRADAATGCNSKCLEGRGRWVWVDKSSPGEVLARAARDPIMKLIPKEYQVRYGPKLGATATKTTSIVRYTVESRPGYRCPGCGFLADSYQRLRTHLTTRRAPPADDSLAVSAAHLSADTRSQLEPAHTPGSDPAAQDPTRSQRQTQSVSPPAAEAVEKGQGCVPPARMRISEELRLRCWLVAPAVKEAVARTRQVDTFPWHSDWKADVRPLAMSESPPRPEPQDQAPGFQLLV